MPQTLIIGYGSLLRGDDAVGCHAAHELEQYYRDDPEVEVMACQELTPELAEDVAHSRFVLFLDARWGETPGAIQRRPVLPEHQPGDSTHSLTPFALLAAAGQLYGDAPEGICLTIGGWSFAISNQLSHGLRLRLPEFLGQAKEVVESHRLQPSHRGHLVQSR
jgi:hydrogenase maturation protease